MEAEPPAEIIERAEEEAAFGPCAKSKRGVITWVQKPDRIMVLAEAYNSPPAPLTCLKTPECANTCNKRCVHAEARALRKTWQNIHVGNYTGNDFSITEVQILHVKIEQRPGLPSDGKVVPGGPPSCWQCSRAILDMSIAGIWLYELLSEAEYSGKWRFYTPLAFHIETLKNCAKDPKNADMFTVDDQIQLIKLRNGGQTNE